MNKRIALLLGAALLFAGFARQWKNRWCASAHGCSPSRPCSPKSLRNTCAPMALTCVSPALGSNIARQAQETGQLDLMWEYTGVSLVSYNHIDERMPSAEATFARVKELDAKKDLIWLTPSKFSNTYALGLPKQVAEAYPQVNTISDLNQVLRDESQRNHLVALDTEFANRPDGLVGLREMYGLPLDRRNIRQMDGGLVYTAMRNNQVFAGLVYTTDGRLSAFNLKLLEDDKHYFPDYTAAPVVRKAVLDANPQLAALLKPLAEQLDDETMRQLNAKVDVEHQNRLPWPPPSCASTH